MVNARILIVEDDRATALVLNRWLTDKGYHSESASDCKQALAMSKKSEWDLVLLDYILPDGNGMELIQAVKVFNDDLPIIFMTAHGSVELAVKAIKAGAVDYITKPLNRDALLMRIGKVLKDKDLRQQLQAMSSALKLQGGNMVASSEAMCQMMERVQMVAESDSSTVLLLGESGVGKNLVAQEIHDRSARAKQPFMSVLCTALPGNLLESELFGHERGAFTDAKVTRKGLVELSDGGTIFLDELGEMPLELQSKLLQFLEDRGYRRVGGTTQRSVNVRVIAATNRDLALEVREGRFRADLFYRLNVIEIILPPLRDRPADILPLAQHFIGKLNPKLGKQVKGLTPAASTLFRNFSWPGNVRELKNLLERAMILSRSEYLDVENFPGLQPESSPTQVRLPQDATSLSEDNLNLVENELALIRRALTIAEGNQSHAARLLGISRNTLLYRLKKFQMEDFQFSSKANVKVQAVRREIAVMSEAE